jgi:hypothetical protein
VQFYHPPAIVYANFLPNHYNYPVANQQPVHRPPNQQPEQALPVTTPPQNPKKPKTNLKAEDININ